MSEKIQKVLARIGVASRREVERWIVGGRIKVNGTIAQLGDRIDAQVDQVEVDDKLVTIAVAIEPEVIVYHKPAGELVTRSDPEGRATVFQRLPRCTHGRWITVGRLDCNTSGLLLFTNDGDLANGLMHPKNAIEREYAVRILGDVDQAMLKRLTHGVRLDDGMARFEHIVDSGGKGSNHWYHVLVNEGRNRLVRRLWESQGIVVSRLSRVRFGPIFLERSLRAGSYKHLTTEDIQSLRQLLLSE